ncbi:MAG: hypothetical protein ACO25K_06955 [Candidatus Fonsibacter ubiquis]
MKKLITYTISANDKKWKNSLDKNESFTYLNKQVISSLKCGWKPNDIIIATNFNYEFLNVKAFNIEDLFKNQVGCCLSKYIGLNWAIETFNENIWLNDHDNFQIQKFDTKQIDYILNSYYIYCSGKIKKTKNNKQKIQWSDLSIFFSPKCKNYINNFIDKYKNLNTSKGAGFKAAEFFFKHIESKILMENYYKYPYRFNVASDNLDAWRSRIYKFEKNKILPFCIHGKLDNLAFKNASEYLNVCI